MKDVLAEILARKREEVAALEQRHSGAELERMALEADPPRGFCRALSAKAQQGAAVIAEIKKASPSKGLIRADFDPAWIAREYETGGAACLSVLTDEKFFQGHNDYLKQARVACSLPVLRKDFIIDAAQVLEARAIGADCVLLIAAALTLRQLSELGALAQRLGMDVLLEVHDRTEMTTALNLSLPQKPLLGINNRNLRTFQTRLETTLDLLGLVPAGYTVVTESGITSHADIVRMQTSGVNRFLVGESLMRQPSPAEALRNLLAPVAR